MRKVIAQKSKATWSLETQKCLTSSKNTSSFLGLLSGHIKDIKYPKRAVCISTSIRNLAKSQI